MNISPDPAQHPEKIFLFILFFIPDQDFVKKRMTGQQLLISLSQQKIDLGLRKVIVKFFNQPGSQHNIANKSCLYN